ncbi:hypothetical protein [Kribbella swartbergensis]
MTRYERGAEKDWTHHIFDFSKRLTVWIDAAGVAETAGYRLPGDTSHPAGAWVPASPR